MARRRAQGKVEAWRAELAARAGEAGAGGDGVSPGPQAETRELPAGGARVRRYTGAIGALIAPLLVAAGLVALAMDGGGFEPGVYAAAAVVLWWGAVVAVVARVWPGGAPPRGAILAGLCLAALAALSFASLAWAPDDGRAFAEGARVLAYLGLFVLAVVISRAGGGRAVLAGLALGLLAVTIVALLNRAQPGLFSIDPDLEAITREVGGRLSYPIGYWNGLAAAMALLCPLLAWLGTAAASPIGRALWTAALPLPLLGLYLAGSRGGLLAAGVALVALVAFAPRRGALLGRLALGGIGGAALILLAAGEPALRDALPGSAAEAGGDRLTFACACVFAIVAAIALRTEPWLSRLRLPSRRAVVWAAAAVVVAGIVAGALILDPGEQIDRFTSFSPVDQGRGGGNRLVSASSSGRSQYWESALDAFSAEPARGIGAGGFEWWWTKNATIPQSVENAHSLFLESLAELGVGGLLLILGFFVTAAVAGIRAIRPAGRAGGLDRGLGAAGLAVLLGGAVAAGLDWIWELPAVFAPAVIAAALLTAPPPGTHPRPRHRRLPLAWGALTVLAGLAAIVASGALWWSESKLESSQSQARDDAEAAADDARAASDALPFSAAPYTQLALIERAQGNLPAAARAIHEARERAPKDWRLWLLTASIDFRRDDTKAGYDALGRAADLAPIVPWEEIGTTRRATQPGFGARDGGGE